MSPPPLVCDAGFGDCNGDPSDGCEGTLDSSQDNCGGCGVLCTASRGGTALCENGQCSTYSCDPREDPACTDCACEPVSIDTRNAPQKWSTVACLCGAVRCPTFSEAWTGVVGICSSRRSGCGVDEFSYFNFAHSWRYQFVAGTIVAGEFTYDTTAPPCDRFGYQGGEFTDLTQCADFTGCMHCPGEVSTVDRPLCEAGG